MKVSLYLIDYETEIIKNDKFYKIKFFDTIHGLVFGTYIHENSIKDFIKTLDNGNKKILESLRKLKD